MENRAHTACRAEGLLIVQRRDEATERAERQFSKSAESGAHVWSGLEDPRGSKVIPVFRSIPP